MPEESLVVMVGLVVAFLGVPADLSQTWVGAQTVRLLAAVRDGLTRLAKWWLSRFEDGTS